MEVFSQDKTFAERIRFPVACGLRRVSRFLGVTISIVALTTALRGAGLCQEIAEASAPLCPTRAGVRQFRSAEISAPGIQAYIVGTATRQGACRRTVELRIKRGTLTNTMVLAGDNEADDFRIVDFSANGEQMFLYRDKFRAYPNEELRNVEIAAVPISSGPVRWQDLWDLMHWDECDATVDPLGFVADGRLVISARPSVMSPARRRNCVSGASPYAIDLKSATVTELPKAPKISRYSKITSTPWETCKTDPDLVGACFTVHGRLSASNGAPTFRIWRIGTRRVLGVSNDILPESVATNMSWDVEAFGDFLVCPLGRERPGLMQQVCVESARKVTYKKR